MEEEGRERGSEEKERGGREGKQDEVKSQTGLGKKYLYILLFKHVRDRYQEHT